MEEGGEEEEDEEKESRDREEGLAAMPGHGAAVLREGGRGKGCPGRAQALGLWGSLVGESPVPYACGVAREGGSEGGGCEMSAKICLACLSLQAAGKQVQQQALPIFQCVGISLQRRTSTPMLAWVDGLNQICRSEERTLFSCPGLFQPKPIPSGKGI